MLVPIGWTKNPSINTAHPGHHSALQVVWCWVYGPARVDFQLRLKGHISRVTGEILSTQLVQFRHAQCLYLSQFGARQASMCAGIAGAQYWWCVYSRLVHRGLISHLLLHKQLLWFGFCGVDSEMVTTEVEDEFCGYVGDGVELKLSTQELKLLLKERLSPDWLLADPAYPDNLRLRGGFELLA